MYFHELRPGDMFVYYRNETNDLQEKKYVTRVELVLSVVPVLGGTQICWWEVYDDDPLGDPVIDFNVHPLCDVLKCGEVVRNGEKIW